MTLSSDQIKNLYQFTQQHFVEYYDVQTELVDHLATGIEAQWANNLQISFNDALQTEFKKFGVMGFSSVVEQKTKALNTFYWQQIWRCYREYIALPKIVLTIAMVAGFYKLLIFSMAYHVNWVLAPTLTLLFGIPWYVLIKEYKHTKKRKAITGKKWLLDHTIAQLGGVVHFMNIAIYFQVFFHNKGVWSNSLALGVSILVVFFGLLLYIAIAKVVPQLRKDMAKQYITYHKV